jgi:hypothetical protein
MRYRRRQSRSVGRWAGGLKSTSRREKESGIDIAALADRFSDRMIEPAT